MQVENDGEGNVKFVNRGGPPRLTAAAALRHTFVKRVRPASSVLLPATDVGRRRGTMPWNVAVLSSADVRGLVG